MINKFYIGIIIVIIIIFYNVNQSSSKKTITNLIENYTNIKFINSKKSNNDNDYNIIVHNDNMFDKIALNGELGLAESYMDGDWDSNNLQKTMLELLLQEKILLEKIRKQSLNMIFMEIKTIIKSKLPNNTIESSAKNIALHYNVGNDLYKKMLGKHMQYTCAYFYKPNMSLDEAQYAKMELVAKKLNLKPNMKVIDIGCGFGSMAYHLANKYKVHVTGVTLSKEQVSYAHKYLSHPNVNIELKDYRHVKGKFDRVYSVGILEHIGRKNYQEYYDKCYELLKPNGIMFIHTIGRYNILDTKTRSNGFIQKYIFPEAELPNINNLTKVSTKWILHDFQNIGKSYVKTLQLWKKNIGDWSGLDKYDTRFRRMWFLYLDMCAAGFEEPDGMQLFQLVYTRKIDNTDNCHYIRN